MLTNGTQTECHQQASARWARPGTIVTTSDGVSCVMTGRPELLDGEDGWGWGATIIGPPTHPKLGHCLTIRFDEMVKPCTLPSEIQEALRVVPRAPISDDVVPRTNKQQQRLSDDILGLRMLLDIGRKNIGTKANVSLSFALNDLERMQRVLDQTEAIAQQAIETHDVMTAANVPDANTLRERVEGLIVDRVINKDRADIHSAMATPVIKSNGWIGPESMQFARGQEEVYNLLRAILGRVPITESDRDLAANEQLAERAAILRTIKSTHAECHNLHSAMQLRGGFPCDADGSMVFSLGRLLARHEALERLQIAYSKVDVLAANGPLETWSANLERHITSMKTQAATVNAQADAFKAVAQVGNIFNGMRAKTWMVLAGLRPTTGDKRTPNAPEVAPGIGTMTLLIDVFNCLGDWHKKADVALIASSAEPDMHRTIAYQEGIAHGYAHAMDLIVTIGRGGYELVKQQ